MKAIDAERFKRIIQNMAGHLKEFGCKKDGELFETFIKYIDLQPTIDGVYLSKKEYEELLEYKHMYENLCK